MYLRPHFIRVFLFMVLQYPVMFFAQTFDQDLKLMIRAIGDTFYLCNQRQYHFNVASFKDPLKVISCKLISLFCFSQMF